MDRAAFLQRVRTAVAGSPPVERPASWPAAPGSGGGSDTPPAERFAAELAKTTGVARVVGPEDLAQAVADVAREVGAARAVVAEDTEFAGEAIDEGLRLAGVESVRPSAEGWRGAAAETDLGVTSAHLGVAATGSILIVPSPGSPRVASLLPPAHLAIVPVGRLVAGLEDAMAALTELVDRSSAPVLVTGPSNSSDIEMITVHGVHGPRVLRVLLVEGLDES
jgi:L-lactate dehydrogenase complex protein LldG